MSKKTNLSLIDFHCHILPGADHGSDGLETSLKQVENALKNGVNTVVATPHYYPSHDSFQNFIDRRASCAQTLRDAMKEQNLPLRLELGAEVTLDHPKVVDQEGLEQCCIADSRYMILEMPRNTAWMPWMFDAIYSIQLNRKITPIIAHVDRYPVKWLEPLLEMNIPLQVNAASMVHFMKRHELMPLVESGKICFLGSDTHGPGNESFADFAKAAGYLLKSDGTFFDYAREIIDAQ